MKKSLFAPILIAVGLTSAPAMAAPISGGERQPAVTSVIEQVQAYHRDCAWVDNKWTYRRGDKVVVCRPMRPAGSGWVWHREGNRFGWYHRGRKAWHNDKW